MIMLSYDKTNILIFFKKYPAEGIVSIITIYIFTHVKKLKINL